MAWVLAGLGAAGSAASIGGVAAFYAPTHRECSVKITNNCSRYTLDNPSVYIYSGSCKEPLPFKLNSNSSGSAVFIKTPNTACGAVGVFTYNLVDKSAKRATEKIAVMFSVPYDFNLYSSWYAVGVFDMREKCDYNLYHQMYNYTGNTFVRNTAGSNIQYNNSRVTIEASMGTNYEPVMKVEVILLHSSKSKMDSVLAGLGAAGAVASIGGVAAFYAPTHRECSVKITNNCSRYTLDNPSVYIYSGSCKEHLPFKLNSNSSGSAVFIKTPNTACGAVGVFTYNLVDKSAKRATEKIAVMFSVPYDFNLYSSWYAVGVFDMMENCNYDLYYQMYNYTGNTFVRNKAGSNIQYNNSRVTIEASMGTSYQPVMKVEVSDD